MSPRVALLSVFLAGPALAAPPAPPAPVAPRILSPEADNAAILAAISDGDPGLTPSPSPVASVIAAAELAERRLAAATDLDTAAELLTLAGMGRDVAYQRTGAPEHLCALIAVADDVLRRPNLPSTLGVEAGDFRDRTRRVLADEHPAILCATPQTPANPPKLTAPPAAPASGPVPPPQPAAGRVRPTSATIAGGIILGFAGLSAVALTGVQIHRAGAVSKLDGVLGDVRDADGKTQAQAQEIEHLRSVERRTDAATAGLGVSLGVFAALGVSLTIWGRRQAGPTRRARLSPHGGPREIGVALTGHF